MVHQEETTTQVNETVSTTTPTTEKPKEKETLMLEDFLPRAWNSVVPDIAKSLGGKSFSPPVALLKLMATQRLCATFYSMLETINASLTCVLENPAISGDAENSMIAMVVRAHFTGLKSCIDVTVKGLAAHPPGKQLEEYLKSELDTPIEGRVKASLEFFSYLNEVIAHTLKHAIEVYAGMSKVLEFKDGDDIALVDEPIRQLMVSIEDNDSTSTLVPNTSQFTTQQFEAIDDIRRMDSTRKGCVVPWPWLQTSRNISFWRNIVLNNNNQDTLIANLVREYKQTRL